MNPRVLLRLLKPRAAAVPATPESIRASHRLTGLRFGGTRGGLEAVPPPVHCSRDLGGHAIDPKTVYRAVIR